MYNRPTVKMVEELNNILKEEGSCLRYVEGYKTRDYNNF